jgi:hypothetical protein
VACALLAALVVGASPIDVGSREKVIEIPQGTWQRRMTGHDDQIFPERIWLTLGVSDVMVLRNRDDVPQLFESVMLMPGQTFRLPFDVASTYHFACTAHASGQLTVVVDPEPTSMWRRLRWRMKNLHERWG